MSLNELSNSVFPNTLNGLDSLNVTDITVNGQTLASLYVPYTGAVSNTDLNNKSLTGVNTLSATSVTASGLVQGLNVTATGLTTTNTLKINSVPSGTVVKALAVDASGNVIEGSLIPSQINVTGVSTGLLYFTYVQTNSAGVQTIYIDTSSPMYYNASLDTLYVKNLFGGGGSVYNCQTLEALIVTSTTLINALDITATGLTSTNTLTTTGLATVNSLKINSVPSGTAVYSLAVDATGNVIAGSSTIPTQITVANASSGGSTYYPALFSSQTAGNQAIYVESGGGYAFSYRPFTQMLETFNMTIFYDLKLNALAAGTVAFGLAVDSTGKVIKTSSSSQPTITSNIGPPTMPTIVYLVGTDSTSTTLSAPIYVDSTGRLNYNQATNTLFTQKLNVSGAITTSQIIAPTTLNLGVYSTKSIQYMQTYSPSQVFVQFLAPHGLVAGDTFIVTGNASALFNGTYTVAGVPAPVSTGLYTTYNYDPASIGSQLGGTATLPSVPNNILTLTASGIVSPVLTGIPTAPTGLAGTSSTQIATQEFVIDSLPNLTGYIQKTGTQVGINTALQLLNGSSKFEIQDTAGNPLLTVTTPTCVITGATTISNTLNVTSAFEATGGGCFVKSQYLHLYNASDPHLNITPFGGAGNYFGQVSTVGAFIEDSAVGDLCINSRTGNIRIAGGSQFARTNLLITNSGIGHQAGSMFDFSVAGNWNGSNALYMTTGGLGGNNLGVGFGHSTTLDSGLLVSIAPNVAWKNMTYKALQHFFYVSGNTFMAGVNANGLFSTNAGYMTNNDGAFNAGLTGYGTGDQIFYANASGVMRFYTGSTNKIAFGAGNIYADSITMFGLPSVGISRVAIGNNTGGYRHTLGKLTLNSSYVDLTGDPAQGFVMDMGDGGVPTVGNYRMQFFPYIQAGANVATQFQAVNGSTAYDAFQILSQGTVRFNQKLTFGNLRGTNTDALSQGFESNAGTTYGSFSTYGKKNGWGGMSLEPNLHYCMSDSDILGLYDQRHGWLLRNQPGGRGWITDVVNNQTYIPNQVLIGASGSQIQWGAMFSYYYANTGISWAGGVFLIDVFKSSASSYMRVSGSVSHYISYGGMTSYFIRFYNVITGGTYDYYQYNYTNLTGNHASYPCMVQTGSLPAGTYYIYMYQSSNIVTDTNDSVYLLIEVVAC